jgi:hypothetical protein
VVAIFPILITLCRESTPDLRIDFAGMRPIGHEEDVPAQQSSAKEDPRLPSANAHERRPARAQAAPAKGPKAHRSLTRGAPRGGVSTVDEAQERRRISASARKRSAPARAALSPGGGRERSRARQTGPHREPEGRRRGLAQPCPAIDAGGLSTTACEARRSRLRPRGARREGSHRTQPRRGGS